MAEVSKLNQIINEAEAERVKQQKEYDDMSTPYILSFRNLVFRLRSPPPYPGTKLLSTSAISWAHS